MTKPYADAEEDAYTTLFDYIRNCLFSNSRVVTMVELTEKLVSHTKEYGVEEIRASTKKHIRHKLEGEFGMILVIFPDDNRKLITPDNLHAVKMEREIKYLKEDSDSLDLYITLTLHIRDEMKKPKKS